MKMVVFADPMLKRQGKEMMKSSVDEGIRSCDVVFVTLQFRSEDDRETPSNRREGHSRGRGGKERMDWTCSRRGEGGREGGGVERVGE